MENTFNTTPNEMRRLLDRVDMKGASPEIFRLLDNLFDMVSRSDPDFTRGDEPMRLCDLSSYKSYTLWSGKEDVEYLLEHSYLNGVLQQIAPEDREQFVASVSNTIDWDERFSDCSVGNEIIRESIVSEFSQYVGNKPFVVEGSILVNDDTFDGWCADLLSSDYLINKLENEALSPGFAELLDSIQKPEFFAEYNPASNQVSVYGAFHYGPSSFDGMQDAVSIPLSAEDTKAVAAAFEDACKKQEVGFDCLTALNDVRRQEGLVPLNPFKQPLANMIRTAQESQSQPISPYQHVSSFER